MGLALPNTAREHVWYARPGFGASAERLGRCLLAGAACVGGVIAAVFASLGAWMVMPFTGLELLALWWALRRFAGRVGDFDEIRLDATHLLIVSHLGGVARRHEFHPYWAQVELRQDASGGRLLVRSHGREAEIGRSLAPAQKALLARELQSRLAALRTTPTGSPLKEDS